MAMSAASLAPVPYFRGPIAVNDNNRETLRQAAQKLTDRDERFLTLLSELKAAVAVTAVRTMGGLVDKATSRIDNLEPTVKATARTVRVWTIRAGLAATGVIAVGGFLYANGATIWKAIRAVLPS